MKKTIYSLSIIVVLILIATYFVVTNEKSTTVAGQNPVATVAIQSVSNDGLPASAVLAGAKTITWQSNNYPSSVGVDINLLQKVSDSPASYTLVSKIAQNISNSGTYIWTPTSSETGTSLYVEVTCATGNAVTAGCQVASQPVQI